MSCGISNCPHCGWHPPTRGDIDKMIRESKRMVFETQQRAKALRIAGSQIRW